ncbi:MAG: hypothetical protein P4L34_11340 [Paludibacter sp.]|nr:hypothetical protein [Paludibacter sp.]
MKRVNLLAIFVISFGLTSLVSCTSNLTSATDSALTTTATDEGQAASISDQIVSSADDYTNNLDASGYQAVSYVNANSYMLGVHLQSTDSLKITTDSITITVDRPGLNDYPKVICINFGTKGVTVKRGNVLKGKVYITVSGKMTLANSTRTFTYSNFYVNDNQVKGTKVVTYMGLNTSSQPYWTISANDSIIRSNGNIVTWNSQRVRTRIDDNNTPLIYWDDTYSITGTSSGVNAKGVAYTAVIQDSNPLIIGGGFPYFTKGTIVITTDTKTVTIDYGDGTKDAIATATINGVTKQFNLKK